MKWIYLFAFTLFFQSGFSQNLSAYSDYRNYFYIFDNGIKKEMDYLPVKSYKIDRKCIAYEDHSGTLKIYYNGKVYEIFEGVTDYFVTKNIVLGKLGNQIKIFDKGNITTLSKNAGSFALGDSIIAFHDKIGKTFNAYYNGEITQLEDLIITEQITNFKAGSNIIAYINNQNEFKLFYKGVISELFIVNNAIQYDVGQDIVAYNNNDELSFNVFYKNENYKIEDFFPLSFIVGNNCVAYVDNTGKFKLFKDGNISTISEISPDFYKVKDDMVIYSEQNYLKVYYLNKSYLLEYYIPSSYKFDQGSVAYLDKMGNLKLFCNGKTETISYETVKYFDLNGNILNFTTGNDNKIFFNGKHY